MKTSSFLLVGAAAVAIFSSVAYVYSARAASTELSVPFVAQAPDGAWIAPWDESCEEASLIMLESYYAQKTEISPKDSKPRIQQLVKWEMERFKNYQDTTAEETAELIRENSAVEATVVRNPSIGDIKQEVDAGRPVVALVDMYDLYQERDLGDSYHVLIINGYDDERKQFIFRDPARKDETRHPYDVTMKALHDYNPSSKEADGEPTAIFTSVPSSMSANKPSSGFFNRIVGFFQRVF